MSEPFPPYPFEEPEPLPPAPRDGAGVRPEDGDQDVSQDHDEVYGSEVDDDDGDAGS